MSVKEIFEGWKNVFGKKNNYVENVAKQRMEICRECPYRSTKGIEHCTECGCPLVGKTRSLSSSCPVGRWGAVELSR